MRAEKLNTINIFNVAEKTLTEIEALGLESQFDLANGHASHEISHSQQAIINKLPLLWERSAKQKSRDAEWMFKYSFQQLASTPSLIDYEYFKICPTASNSIDVVAAWLAENQLKTALIEPTFDNLYLILKRRGVELASLPEELLHDGSYTDVLKHVDAVFLVNPNNPTGKMITHKLFEGIINWCAANKKVIILDHSFRFFMPQLFDIYRMLLDAQVTFLCIEDTGKVWPTQEIKASLLICSGNVYQEIDVIYDEIFLCHSSFSLGILTEFLRDAHERGLYESIWKQVAVRRKIFRNALDNHILSIHKESMTSMLSVEWVKVGYYFANDLDLAEHFRRNNLILLPGRQFYWHRKGQFSKTDSVRFALLKPEHEFLTAVDFIKMELQRLSS